MGRQAVAAQRNGGWLALSALMGAGAALALPGTHGGVAAILAVGGVAALAGHAWGLLVAAVADVALLGRLWPYLGPTHHLVAAPAQLAAATAIVMALPVVIMLGLSLPRLADVVLDQPSTRARTALVAAGALALAAAIVGPAL